jgi:hypothetical protein
MEITVDNRNLDTMIFYTKNKIKCKQIHVKDFYVDNFFSKKEIQNLIYNNFTYSFIRRKTKNIKYAFCKKNIVYISNVKEGEKQIIFYKKIVIDGNKKFSLDLNVYCYFFYGPNKNNFRKSLSYYFF